MKKLFICFLILWSVICLNSLELKEVWRFNTKEQTTSYLNVYKDKVYINAGEYIENGFPFKIIYCLDIKTGKQVWKFQTESALSNPYFTGDTLISWDTQYIDKIYCLNKDTGRQVWKFDFADKYQVWGWDVNDKLVLSDNDEKFYNIDLASGKIKPADTVKMPEYEEYNEVIVLKYKDGEIKISGSQITFIRADKIVWDYANENRISDPIISGKNLYFVTEKERAVYCMDCETKAVLWIHHAALVSNVHEPELINFRFLAYNSKLIVSTYDGFVYCMNE